MSKYEDLDSHYPSKITKIGYDKSKANVYLHQDQNVIYLKINECDIQAFIMRFRRQIEKVEISFSVKNKTQVEIYFREIDEIDVKQIKGFKEESKFTDLQTENIY